MKVLKNVQSGKVCVEADSDIEVRAMTKVAKKLSLPWVGVSTYGSGSHITSICFDVGKTNTKGVVSIIYEIKTEISRLANATDTLASIVKKALG